MNLPKKVIVFISFLLLITLFASTFTVTADALRCRHDKGTRWVEKPDGTGHFEICNECGARLKTEDHDLFDDSKWNWTYYDADVIGGQPGEHAQICKKCGYTNWLHHSYSSQNWDLNGKMHPNVLVCLTPGCNHVKEFDENSYDGYQRYHIYYTSYVNFDYHKTDCVYCGYTPTGHKTTQRDYATHVWHFCRNASQHWMECFGCHATYDKAGHNFVTYEDDNQGFGPAHKTTVCETCGWVKSIKSTDQRNEKGIWFNFKEQLKTQQDIINYNSGTVDIHYVEKPGGTKADPCRHPIKAYEESAEENRYYTYIGGKHIVRCGSCGEALSTENCTFEIETYERVRRQYIEDRPWIFEDPELGPDYVNNLYMEEYFGVGHYRVCTKCGGKELVAHNWDNTNGSNATADSCVRTCKDCGFAKRFQSRLKETDPSPHFYLTYQDNYVLDAQMVVHDPDDGCCSYTNAGSSHRAKCEYCGYEHTEHCDTLGWAELPGQPGKHLQFCSKCGGGKRVVDCGHDYVAAENASAGFHAVKCPTCCDLYIPKTPCDYILDEKNTDAFVHTYKCSYCGFEWHSNHTRKTIKTNVVPATANTNGHYDLLTWCEVCNTEISRSTITIPKENNPTALGYVEGRYLFDTRNQAHMGSGSSFLNGTIVMDGVAEYLANHSAELLSGVTFDPSHSFYDDGKQISANDSTRIVLYANLHMVVTDYTQDEDDLDEDDDRDEYTSMTATLTFTYSAYYVTTVNGVEYRDNTAVILDQPLDLSGTPITLTLPLLTGLSSFQTMFVRQSTDDGTSYATYLGDYHSDWGLATVTFTTEDGFDGEFLFIPTEHWLEHFERQEPTDKTDGNIEYWYSKNQEKYYSDILCEHEITKAQTYLIASTYTISFASGGGSGTAPAPITGVHKQEDVILPACTFTNPGYVFYGWSSGDWVYKAGDLYTVTGDATLTAKWHVAGDTMCHVTYHANGGEGIMDEQVCRPGDVIRLQSNAFTREGHTFYGWSTTPERQVPPYAFDKATVSPDTDLDLYAIWCPTYYITFDANGGQGTMEKQAYKSTPMLPDGWYVQYDALVNNTFTRDGYRFVHWATNPDGTGNTYSDGVSPIDTTNPENVTLYAIWEQTRFTVTFDANCDDASGCTESMQIDTGIWDVIPQCGYEREGYVFVKWAENPDGSGSTTYKPGLLRTFYSDKTLYAVWQKTWKVTFDPNGADNTMPEQIVTDGESTRLSGTVLVKDGFEAASYCWNTEPDGTGTKYYNEQRVTLTGDLTLYAQWTQTRFTITYDPNGGEGTAFDQIVDKNELASGEYAKVEENTFERERYSFVKWNTKPDGSGTSFTPGNSIYTLADMTLYAIWKPDFFSVTFHANGGEGEMEPQIIDKNVPTVLRKNTFTRDGYIFLGWGSSAGATYGYNDEAEYTSAYANDVTLYARWAKEITITFDAGEGFGSMAQQIVAENVYTALNPNTFLHETKGFNYWSLTPGGERAYYATSSVKLTEDVTLYAVWKDKSNASSKISFEDATLSYTGKAPALEVTLAQFTQYSNPKISFLYYSGNEVTRENWLPEAPTAPGVYTVRAIYEDSVWKGYKDATLTITKAERNLTPTTSLLLLHGADKSIALRLSDADGSALPGLTLTSGDATVVAPRAEWTYKTGGILMAALAYKGAGYTTVTFSLPESDNYLAAEATVTVLSKSGYDVTISDVDELGGNAALVGGTVTVSSPTAPAGAVVTIAAKAKIGWSFDHFVVTNDVTGQSLEVENCTFTMPDANVTVSAVFTQNNYTIETAAVDGVNYGELPAGVHYGDTVVLTASASEGKAVKAFICVYGAATTAVTPDRDGVFTLKMPAENVTVTAVPGDLYNVSVGDQTGGSLLPSAAKTFEGATVTLTVTPVEGYRVGAVTFTANGITKAVSVGADENGQTYSFIMPNAETTVGAQFLPAQTVIGAQNAVNGTTGAEQGKTEADISVNVDAETAAALRAAAEAVSAVLTAEGGGESVSADQKISALEALAQAGLISITNEGVKDGENAAAQVRVVDKTYMDVSVKEYEKQGDEISMTLEITPMKQTVATLSAGMLDNANSVPLGAAQALPVDSMTIVTVGIPAELAAAAGGAGKTVYVRHIHSGVTYEYPATVNGNAVDGYTATFENPNGYSEFTIGVKSATVASFVSKGTTYAYTSFAEAVAGALDKGADSITMHRMPEGADVAEITREVTLTFTAAAGSEGLIDFDALYSDRILPGVDVKRASSAEQLENHVFAYTSGEELFDPADIDRDGSVTVSDVTALLDYLALENGNDAAYDIDNDGFVNVRDVTALLDILAGVTTPAGGATESYQTGRQQFYEVTGVMLPLLDNVEAGDYPYTPGDKGYCFDLIGGSGLSRDTFDTLKTFLDETLAAWTSETSVDGPYTNVNYTSDAGWIGLTWDAENMAVYVNANMN